MRTQRGFTAAELIIALVLFILLCSATLYGISGILTVQKREIARVELSQFMTAMQVYGAQFKCLPDQVVSDNEEAPLQGNCSFNEDWKRLYPGSHSNLILYQKISDPVQASLSTSSQPGRIQVLWRGANGTDLSSRQSISP